MAYGDTEESALRKAKAIALQVLADRIETGDELPQLLRSPKIRGFARKISETVVPSTTAVRR
jgi:predicted RNase H-like HicB family nuclease